MAGVRNKFVERLEFKFDDSWKVVYIGANGNIMKVF
jgi:hypothetical protein